MSFLLRSDLPLRKLCYLFLLLSCFYFNDPAATEIYTLSLHDALPISWPGQPELLERIETVSQRTRGRQPRNVDDLLAVRDDNALANAIPALSLSDPTVLIQHGLEALEVVVPLLTGTAHGRAVPDRLTQCVVPALQALVHRPPELSVSRRLPRHGVDE